MIKKESPIKKNMIIKYKKGRKKVVFFGFGVKKMKIVTLWHSVALYGTSLKLDYVVFIDYL
jgi:hypothetical protein